MAQYKEKITAFHDAAGIWLHRCNHYGKAAWKMLGYDYDTREFSDEKGCYISIGCGSGTWSVEEYTRIRESGDLWREFEQHYNDRKPRARYFLYQFFFALKANDYVVIPSGSEFHVFQIESDEICTYDDACIANRINEIGLSVDEIRSRQHDFKFFRKVKPIRVQISRKGYATGQLYSKLKYQGTTLEIKEEAAENLKKALAADSPFSIYDHSMQALKQALYDALIQITPDQFEHLVAWYFMKKGADLYQVLPKNYAEKVENEDVDVLGVFEDLKIRFFVQVKDYQARESEDGSVDLSGAEMQIEKYMEYHIRKKDDHYTNVKWIVCLAESDNAIRNLSEIDKSIRVIHGMEFAGMLLQVGLQDIDSALN